VRTITISQPLQVLLVGKTNNSCRNTWDGTITVSAGGGVAPYTYNIDSYGYGSSGYFSLLGPFTYTVRAKDAAGTVSSMTVTILASSAVCGRMQVETVADAKAEPLQLLAFPNPTHDYFTLRFNNTYAGNRNITIMTMDGRIAEQVSVLGSQVRVTLGQKLAAGTYLVKVQEGSQVKTTTIVKAQ
jgi:hypothetical protein